MNDYERGFQDGFAAAARCGPSGRTIAGGYADGSGDGMKKISIGFENDTFEFIRTRAVANNRSFSAEVRKLVDAAALNTAERDT